MTHDRPISFALGQFATALALALFASGSAADGESLQYRIDYSLDLSVRPAIAELTVEQAGTELRELAFVDNEERWSAFEADGELTRDEGRWRWRVPAGGGTLRWNVTIDHRRGQAFDARRTATWALFRGEDVFPAMASRTVRGAESLARFRATVPADWSFISAFERTDDQYFRVDNPNRRFDRPTGWLLAGKRLGVRIERIGSGVVLIAAPAGQKVRRQDMLAFLNWSLPAMREALPNFPERLLIVSANDPFWRGGLSGPASLYVHADRPLISENGTSTLMHELFHVGFRRPGATNDDWIIEGLAEYYSVWLLRRSGSTTPRRFEKTLAELADWARSATGLRGPTSRGAVTARAALVFHALNREIESAHDGRRNLDHVVRRLAEQSGPVSLEELRTVAADVLGRPARTLSELPFQALDTGETSD
ncbi:MAG: hypothetical protein AAFM91_10635 [Pseudomonadota bacterium]